MQGTERFYRTSVKSGGLCSFQVKVKETDLWVSADSLLDERARDLVLEARFYLEGYIARHPSFATTLLPFERDPYAPAIIKEMIEAGRAFRVGPMASVAGAIAQYTGQGLLHSSGQVIVENGGDIFLDCKRDVTVSLFAGRSKLSGKLGICLRQDQMPAGVCSSSASVGHSLSMGAADLVCVVAESAAAADAAATALGNGIKEIKEIQEAIGRVRESAALIGGIAVVDDRIATWGDMELVAI